MNEEELEKIREIKDRLENKKHLTNYEKGQLDLIKELRKEKPKTRFERISPIIAGCLAFFALALVIYSIYANIVNGSFAIERASERWANKQLNEDYHTFRVIDKTKGVAFIMYDCTPINKITRGIQRCKGEYYIFLNKTDNKWVVNEDSKTIMW